MATGTERYRGHSVWETLQLKRDALNAARFDDAGTEQWRQDIVEWLAEAVKTKPTRQPAIYLSALDGLSNALNSLPIDAGQFRQYIANRGQTHPQFLGGLEAALRALPLPPPKELNNAYFDLLDKEVEARTSGLNLLDSRIAETDTALQSRLDQLTRIGDDVAALREEIQEQRAAISGVSSTAEATMRAEWDSAVSSWTQDRQDVDALRDAEALAHVTALAATRRAAEALAEHAAGDLSAADWRSRGKRERKAAQWIRFGAVAAFIFAGAIGWFIVGEAIEKDFELTVGDGLLRSSVAVVIAGFGGLLLRESSRHFKEADTAEDVALSLQALAPFYAGSDDAVRLAARQHVGDAVLVKNVLSRFAHRDATKYSGTDLQSLVEQGTNALKSGSREE